MLFGPVKIDCLIKQVTKTATQQK